MKKILIFKNDNDPKHYIKSTKEWLQMKMSNDLHGPDLNPVKHMWNDLKRAVHRRSPHNLADLE